MRLLKTDTVKIEEFAYNEIPKYAVLSHRWGKEEITLQDVERGCVGSKEGFKKVQGCCARAKADGFQYVWIDTCCIDKTSSAELSEAINSMYLWYYEAVRCYAYLADVPSRSSLEHSEWFTRGWTLQELLAPSEVYFLDENWNDLGTKHTLKQVISACTGIPANILSGDDDLETASVAQRMSWASKRKTTRPEDSAYCLMGIFSINMPLIYGEGERAFIRLQEEIMRVSDDHSLFAWQSTDSRGGLLATSPAAFEGSGNIIQFSPSSTPNGTLTVSSRGVHLELPFIGCGPRALGLAILSCKEQAGEDTPVAIYVRDLFWTMETFERVRSQEFVLLHLENVRLSQYPMRKLCIQTGRMKPSRRSSAVEKREDVAQYEFYDDDTIGGLTNGADSLLLLRAAQAGLKDDVWLLLTRSGVEIDLKDIEGRTALSKAAERGHETIFKMLLGKGANIHLTDRQGRTTLSLAAEGGHKTLVKTLLDKGADLNVKNEHDKTPLWWSADRGHSAVAKLLLDNDAEFDSRETTDGQTAMLRAAEKGHDAIVEMLLERGSAVNSKDAQGRTALWWAAEKGYETMVKLLLEKGAVINIMDRHGRAALWLAAENGHRAIVKLMLDNGAEVDSRDRIYSQTALSRAARKGYGAIVKILLENGAAIGLKDTYYQTPLWLAAENKHQSVVKLLLDRGANIDSKDSKYKATALLQAAKMGHANMAKLLVERGADINTQDNHGRSALAWAAERGYYTIAELLLESGAMADLRDDYQFTPLDRASFGGHNTIVKLLREKSEGQGAK